MKNDIVNWKKTTQEIFNQVNYAVNYDKPVPSKDTIWIRADKLKKVLIETFEKYRLPDKEPKLMIEGVGDLVVLVNHPISAYHNEVLERLGLLENGELITSVGERINGEKNKSGTLKNIRHFSDKKALVSSPKKKKVM